jgi:hypothetical protein
VALVGCAGFLFLLHVGDEDLIAGKKHVGISAQLLKVGVVGMVPYDAVVAEAVVFGDFGEVIALLHDVVVSHACGLEARFAGN